MQSVAHWRGVATSDWIYSINPFEEKSQAWPFSMNVLYCRKEDPYCLNNLFGDPALKELQEQLHQLTLQWMNTFEDAFIPYEIMRDVVVD